MKGFWEEEYNNYEIYEIKDDEKLKDGVKFKEFGDNVVNYWFN